MPKVRIVSPDRDNVYKGSTAPGCCAPVSLFVFFTFEGRNGRQKHYKTQFPDSAAGAIFRCEREVRVAECRAFNAFSGQHQSAAA